MPRRRRRPTTELWPEEQDELATKLRYGIGLEQLVGECDAAAIRRRSQPVSEIRHRPRGENVVEPELPRDGHEEERAVQRLGRGHRLGRGWR